jgi:hypothetical protein
MAAIPPFQATAAAWGGTEHVDESLVRAAKAGDEEAVAHLLFERGASATAGTSRALRQAADQGHVGIVKTLLSVGADLHARENQALRRAAKRGHLEIVRHLIAGGADVRAVDNQALAFAASEGYHEVCDALVQAGASAQGMWGSEAWHAARVAQRAAEWSHAPDLSSEGIPPSNRKRGRSTQAPVRLAKRTRGDAPASARPTRGRKRSGWGSAVPAAPTEQVQREERSAPPPQSRPRRVTPVGSVDAFVARMQAGVPVGGRKRRAEGGALDATGAFKVPRQ